MKIPSVSSIEPLEARIAPAFAANLDLGILSATSGFIFGGFTDTICRGSFVSTAGDVNGDGLADMIVGAPNSGSGPDTYGGNAYVIFGQPGGLPAQITHLDGTNGFRLKGEVRFDHAGRSASGAGDINGDGFDDVILGSVNTGNSDTRFYGTAYVIFGKASGFPALLDLGALDGSNGFKLSGDYGERAGYSVSGAGDVNGDGFDDFLVGAPNTTNPGLVSYAYVLFGKSGGFAANLELSTLDGTDGFKLAGGTSELAGRSVSGAGDVNGDGFADVIVGASYASPDGLRSGSAYVVFGHGRSFAARFDLPTVDGSNGFRLNGKGSHNHAGRAVSGVGDLNGDGFADIFVGTAADGYVFYGHNGAFVPTLDLTAIDGTNGFAVNYADDLANVGDVNGDGFPDALVGLGSFSSHGTYSGAAFVIYGSPGGFPDKVNLFALNGTTGFRLSGTHPFDYAGASVSGGGDMNGDGIADLLIGAPAGPAGRTSGFAYVVYGGDPPGQANITPDGHQATFTDIDGDLVMVTTTKGVFTPAMFDLHAQNFGFQLEKLDLTEPAFAGAKVTFTATPQNVDGIHGKEGNGMVNLGYLDATGVNLGKVKLPGDLGLIDAGAVQALNLGSLGTLGTATQDPANPSLHSDLTGNLGKLKIHGDLSGATLAVAGKIGPVRIAGDVDDATITALGTLAPANALDAVAIACVSIGGHVTNSQILAGYDLTGTALNADVSIGKIIVQGNWLASSLAAGIADATQDGFGQNDTLIPGGSDSIIAKIASITIKGTATGSAGAGDFFGITAERIKKAKINGLALALTPNKDDLPLDAANNDFRLVEV